MEFTEAIKFGLQLGKPITDKKHILELSKYVNNRLIGYRYNKGKKGRILFIMGFWDTMEDSENGNWEIMEV